MRTVVGSSSTTRLRLLISTPGGAGTVTSSAFSKKAGEKAYIEGDWYEMIDTNNTSWQIDDYKKTKCLTLMLSKHDKNSWWDCIVKGDAKINKKKIVPENIHVQDLDGETQGIVNKMRFDQMQRQKGLPTSDELKNQDILGKLFAEHPELDWTRPENRGKDVLRVDPNKKKKGEAGAGAGAAEPAPAAATEAQPAVAAAAAAAAGGATADAAKPEPAAAAGSAEGGWR